MPIEYRDKEYWNARSVVTTACAFCGTDIDEGQSLADHLRRDCPEMEWTD